MWRPLLLFVFTSLAVIVVIQQITPLKRSISNSHEMDLDSPWTLGDGLLYDESAPLVVDDDDTLGLSDDIGSVRKVGTLPTRQAIALAKFRRAVQYPPHAQRSQGGAAVRTAPKKARTVKTAAATKPTSTKASAKDAPVKGSSGSSSPSLGSRVPSIPPVETLSKLKTVDVSDTAMDGASKPSRSVLQRLFGGNTAERGPKGTSKNTTATAHP